MLPRLGSEGTEVIGRYVLHGEIASGGMATVYFGKLLGPMGFARPVAIKRLHPQIVREPNVRDMFIDEARLASRIRHTNVVPTLDVVIDGNELLLVMEYVHGESLQQLLRAMRRSNERIPIRFALAILSGVLHGLHAAHEATTETGEPLNIVHRDVSPHNVICGVDGVARLLDFGVARADVRLECTREGIVKGKLSYMAPEQFAGAPVDRRADIYAAGVLLWEMLTGRRLFVLEDDASVMIDKIVSGIIEPPRQIVPEVPRLLNAIALHALRRDPEQRFATAREMALSLEKFDIAHPSEIGEWVEATAAESLARRNACLQELEMTSSIVRIEPQAAPFLRNETTSSPSRHEMSVSPVPTVPRTGEHEVVRRSRTGALVFGASAFVGGTLVVAVLRPYVSVGERGAGSAGVATGAVAAAAWVPPPPTCPSGMANIPGGKSFMGNDEGPPMERPSHNVSLSPFCIDLYEVTTEDYNACTEHGECKRAGITNDWDGIDEPARKAFDPLCNARDPQGRAQHPINCVDWDMAMTFCRAHGRRLPTEAEWEFSARGSDGRTYPWGDEPPGPTLLNGCGKECVEWGRKNHVETKAMYWADDGWPTTSPVGSFPKGASPYGLQDVVGNVWEWVADWYAEYPNADLVDPSGPASGDERVIRGGAWNGVYAAWARPTFRYKEAPRKRSYGIGFRCAKSL